MSTTIREVFPYLRVRGAPAAIAFYEAAFGCEVSLKLVEPSSRVGHAELKLGPMTLMLSDEFPEYGIRAPGPDTPTTGALHLHVTDADALVARCVELGARVVRPLADQFYGERSGTIVDPFGHEWLIGQHIEDVSPEEMQRRYDAMFEEG